MSNPEFTAPDYTSQTAATYKANIDASIAANGNDYINLGLTYSSNTLSIADARGSALSSSNPGFVRFQDPDAPGLSKYISVEANQGFIDDTGASEIINNLFGLTTGVAYGSDIPFYIYAVSNDAMNAVAFMISRVPGLTTSPAAADIGAPDDAVADNHYSFFSFDSLDETLYDNNPCVMVGSFRMQMSASDDWTVQALAVTDGIGRFQEEVVFDVPVATFGAGTNSHFKANGGTAPVFTASQYKYILNHRSGEIHVHYNTTTVSSAGVGAVTLQLMLPFEVNDFGLGTDVHIGEGHWDDNSNTQKNACSIRASAGANHAFTSYVSDTVAERNMQNTYLASNDTYNVTLRFKIALS